MCAGVLVLFVEMWNWKSEKKNILSTQLITNINYVLFEDVFLFFSPFSFPSFRHFFFLFFIYLSFKDDNTENCLLPKRKKMCL